MCYHAEFGCSALNDVGINTGELQKLGSAGTQLSYWEAWLTPIYTPLPDMCYRVQFGRATKGVHINRREPQIREL